MQLQGEAPLIYTIAAGLSFAFLGGLVATRLKLPPIVGYLVAGIIIGPFTPGFVGDLKLAEQLSEIGIVLLMFGVGIHFSFQDLMVVKRIAIPGALIQIFGATLLSTLIGVSWGWPVISSIIRLIIIAVLIISI
jgi:CPA2 family monovalent cation:H+ antiporter-2